MILQHLIILEGWRVRSGTEVPWMLLLGFT